MFKIYDIYTGVHESGQAKGLPCAVIVFADDKDKKGKEMSFNQVVLEIKKIGLKEVCLVGQVTKHEGVRELAIGLAKTSHHVIILTSSSDSIETLRMVRNVSFYINIYPDDGADVNLKTFPLMKETDCLIMPTPNFTAYNKYVALLNSRLMSKPELIFELDPTEKDYEELKESIIEDSKKRHAKTRVYSK